MIYQRLRRIVGPVSKNRLAADRTVVAEGRAYSVDALVRGLREGNERIVQTVIAQVVRDREAGVSHSQLLELICDEFRPRILGFLRRRYFASGDEETLEEVWNDTLQRAYYQLEKFDPRRSAFETWLTNQAKYVAQERFRAAERERKALSRAEPERRGPVDPFAVVVGDSIRGAMQRAYSQLSEQDQKLLFLRHVLGCPHVEIGRRRLAGEVPADQVRVYVSRATERLARLYETELHRDGEDVAPELAREIDLKWPIERFVGELQANGEHEAPACLDADLSAARIGRILRESFTSSMGAAWMSEAEERDLAELEPSDDWSDEEVEALLADQPPDGDRT